MTFPRRRIAVSHYSAIASPAPDFALLVAATGVAALVVGFLRTSIGGGIGLVLTPTLSLVLPPSVVLALIAPLMNLSDPLTLRYYWRQWDRRQLALLLPSMMAGVVLGTWALRSEERRVGKECRSGWSPYRDNKRV